MKSARRALFLVVAALIALYSYAAGGIDEDPRTATSRKYTVTDSLGRTVTFGTVPRRIVLAGKAVLFSVNAAYLFPQSKKAIIGVGATDQGLGDFYPFIEPLFEEKRRYPNNVDAEEIAAADPDLVILKYYLKGQLGDKLESLGIPVMYIDLESPDRFLSDVQTLGALFQDEQRSREIVAYFAERERRIGEVSQSIQLSERPRILVLSYSQRDGDTTFNIPPASWIQTQMVELAGGNPVWKEQATGGGWQKTNFEQIAAWKPDYIFIISYRTPAALVVDRLLSSPNWQAIVSEQNIMVEPFPADFYSWDQPDVRWILGLQWMAKIIHPDSHKNLDLKREVQDFYRVLYGLEQDVVEQEILSRLAGVIF